MKETTIIVWGVVLLLMALGLKFLLKKQDRQLGKAVMYHGVILAVVSLLLGAGLYYFLDYPDINIHWISRLIILVLGVINVWALYKQSWLVRDKMDYEKDSILLEGVYTFMGGIICFLSFASAPQFFRLVDYSVNLSIQMVDFPVIFLVPFLIFKLLDVSSQRPFNMVENQWVFPLVKVDVSNWPWRDLAQVNFKLKKSLLDEYDLFSWWSSPWIEAPMQVELGKIFQLTIQERRARKDLMSLLDMGDEYGGEPQFCWHFYIDRVWYNPLTWFKSRRYLNPNLSIAHNKIKDTDVIVARRVPIVKLAFNKPDYSNVNIEDSEKTVLLNR